MALSRKKRKTARKKPKNVVTRLVSSINSTFTADYNYADVQAYYEAYQQQIFVTNEDLSAFYSLTEAQIITQAVVRTVFFNWKTRIFCNPVNHYTSLFDQRILTEKLLGKPSPGLPPPSIYLFA